ncbi:hypothetical protein MBLNU13_g11132t2 [Cladosporium sp. NU13]
MVLPFEEVASSDEDSISITSTRSSDPEAEYNVEKILAEQVHDDGMLRYLLKWEGYPLHSATWEPAENLLGEQLLSNWEAEKAEHRAGTRSPFDVLEHEAAQEEHIAEKQKRHRRRVAKRRKRGLPSGSTSDASANNVAVRDGDSEDEGPLAAARPKRVKTVNSSSDENRDDEMSISDDSLAEEARNKQRVNTNGNQSAPATSRPAAPLRARSNSNTTATAKIANRVTQTAPSTQKPASARKASASSSANLKPADRPLPSSSARKSAPSTASFGPTDTTTSTRLPVLPTDPPQRKSSGNVTMTLNPAPGPRARRISESDSRHQRYANLSEQNRFLKHSRKEAAPDPSMLGTFNAATGKFDEPVARAPATTSRGAGESSASTVPSVFGRRGAPAPARKRILSPPSPKVAAPSAPTDDNTTPHTKVCWHWRNSTCDKLPGTYYRAGPPGSGVIYYEPPAAGKERKAQPPTEAASSRLVNSLDQRPPDKDVTCHFWLNKKCVKGDRCHFAHRVTEWHAGPPHSGLTKHVPFAVDASSETNAASLNEAGFRRQSLNKSRAVVSSAVDAMDIDDGPPLSAPVTSSNAVPVAQKTPSSVQKQVVEPSSAQDDITAMTPNDTLPTDAPTCVSEHQQTDGSNDNPSSMSAQDLLTMNMERLLNISDVKKEERVFIMMPESKAPEIQLIAKMFEERFQKPDYKGRQCKIWTSLESEVPLWDVPYLGKALHDRVFRVFSINLDSTSAALDHSNTNATCRRLFPMGDVVFLTDDVFLHKPGKVLAIIDKINKGNRLKPPGAIRNKIATRPGIKAWLAHLVIDQKEGTDDPRLSMLLTEIWKLCPIEKENEENPGHPSEDADVISLAPEQLPTFQALLQTDRAKATDYIVNWFAGWAFMNASNSRRFTVCHEEPGTGEKVLDENYDLVTIGFADPRGWGEAFKYLMVKTPDQWLEKEKAKVRPPAEKS